MKKRPVLFLALSFVAVNTLAQHKYSDSSSFPTYQGLIMAGYQGWFNAPGDGANMGWNHFAKNGRFEPDICKFDFWPDVSEYAKTYITPFHLGDGSPAYLFSCYDSTTVSTHFRWMKEYGLDGVFLQRAVTAIKDPVNLAHDNHLLKNALASSVQYHRAIAIMYDFAGLDSSARDWQLIIDDWKYLVDSIHIAGRGNGQTYLYHNGKPLVGIWGVGFPERHNDLRATAKLIDFFKNDPVYGGCAVLLGVPAYWRNFGNDTEKDPYLHELLRKADILRPWFVGRFNEDSYKMFEGRIAADITWCKQYNIDYAPVVFPGFSWHNMHPDKASAQIPRDRGRFYWEQLTGAIVEGSKMIYVAMFDEIDEGTAIFKLSNKPPSGSSKFESLEPGIPTDYYLYLTGIAAQMLRKLRPLQTDIPLPAFK